MLSTTRDFINGLLEAARGGAKPTRRKRRATVANERFDRPQQKRIAEGTVLLVSIREHLE
jgi:hypothetical protein